MVENVKQLRDEFAMAALTGLLVRPGFSVEDGQRALYWTDEAMRNQCVKAYRYADFMLVERAI
jgi:hypothetical protein